MTALLSRWAIPLTLLLVPLFGLLRHQPVYELFLEGAAEGLQLAARLLPGLLAMLCAVAVFRASGAFAALAALLSPLTEALGLPAPVLPLALLRPLSGSGSLAITADILHQCGPDSFSGRLASVMQGSTDTTFYILSVYFGAVGVSRTRYALAVGLGADFCSMLASVLVCRALFPA